MADDTDVKAAFRESADALVALVESIGPARGDDPGTGQWTILELIAHTTRAFIAIEEVLARPLDPKSRRLSDAADYYRTSLSTPGIHEGISERARTGASLMREDPVLHVHTVADRVRQVVDTTPGDLEVQHSAGRIAFGDYLATRVTELVLHTVDLQHALGRHASAPAGAAGIVRDVLVALADRDDALAVACALSGRERSLTCNVLF